MKLRNKKTGEICELGGIRQYWREEKDGGMGYCLTTSLVDGGEQFIYNSLAEMMKEWEDYKPTEPLIKDEKIRKAVRAWAEANNLSGASTYKSCSDSHYWYIRAFDDTEKGIDIDIWGELPKELIDCKYYTIAELCGEEEE